MNKTAKINRFCALCCVLAFCALFFRKTGFFYREILSMVKTDIENYYAVPPANDFLHHLFVEYIKITGRKHINGVTILNDGRLMLDELNPKIYLNERAGAITALKEYLEKRNTPFLYIRAPSKLRDNSQLPKLYDNDIIKNADRFSALLNDSGVDTLDLREEMVRDNLDFADAFYFGDHHWTAETALWAFGKAGMIMNSKYGFRLDEKTWNPSEYDFFVYHKAFLGSESSRINDPRFKEDITVIIPKFHTEFQVFDKIAEDNNNGVAAAILTLGGFVDVFTPKMKNKENDTFTYSDLNSFKGGFLQYKNLTVQEQKKVLLISDSLAWPFVTYLASALYCVDYLYLYNATNKKLYPVLENENYDLVIFLLCDYFISAYTAPSFEDDRLYIGSPPN